MFSRLFARIAAAEPAPPWSIIAALLTVLAAFITVIIGSTLSSILTGQAQHTLLLGWCIAAALTIALIELTRRRTEERLALRIAPSANPLQDTFWYLLIGVGLAITLDLVGRGITRSVAPDLELTPLYTYTRLYGEPVAFFSWLLAFLLMALLQPIAEGLVFQGMLLPALRHQLGGWLGYLLTAAAVGLFHMLVYPPAFPESTSGLWYGFVAPFIAALLYGAVRLYTGSTRAAIFTHVAFGLFAVLKLLTLVGGSSAAGL
ncbi:MAG: CPBP family intramembrane metalloprotease [Anaerolineae bacterium]|nr:CPBP family intramembrane metalloprotease [Anaerolineae bacterium]